MRQLLLPLLLLLCCPKAAGQGTAPIDTAAIVANIDQYMMLVDRSPVMSSYARMTADGPAEPVPAGSPMPPGCLEFIELIVDSMHRVVGAASYKTQRLHEVKEVTFHYFDSQHNTVSVRHELKWLDNRCTFSYAVRNDFQYFYPPRKAILEYTTLTDVEGNNLAPLSCAFPDIKRSMEVYPHLDMFLLMERLKMQ